jgi:hypothetical protein
MKTKGRAKNTRTLPAEARRAITKRRAFVPAPVALVLLALLLAAGVAGTAQGVCGQGQADSAVYEAYGHAPPLSGDVRSAQAPAADGFGWMALEPPRPEQVLPQSEAEEPEPAPQVAKPGAPSTLDASPPAASGTAVSPLQTVSSTTASPLQTVSSTGISPVEVGPATPVALEPVTSSTWIAPTEVASSVAVSPLEATSSTWSTPQADTGQGEGSFEPSEQAAELH